MSLQPLIAWYYFTGLDIGCGANCIYPLLGAALNQWHFVGVDITDVAITWASRNVDANPQLAELIQVRRTGQSSTPLDAANIDQARSDTIVLSVSLLLHHLSQGFCLVAVCRLFTKCQLA